MRRIITIKNGKTKVTTAHDSATPRRRKIVVHNHLPRDGFYEETARAYKADVMAEHKEAIPKLEASIAKAEAELSSAEPNRARFLRGYITKTRKQLEDRKAALRAGKDAKDAERKCPRCRGNGSIMVEGMNAPIRCPRCKGTGKVEVAAKDLTPEQWMVHQKQAHQQDPKAKDAENYSRKFDTEASAREWIKNNRSHISDVRLERLADRTIKVRYTESDTTTSKDKTILEMFQETFPGYRGAV